MVKSKKLLNIVINIIIIMMFLGIIITGFLLIDKGIQDLNSLKDNNSGLNDKVVEPSKELEDLEKELAKSKENINFKKEELEASLTDKIIECDKYNQENTTAFFKNPNGDVYYETKRKNDKCFKERLNIETNIRTLDMENSFFAKDENIKNLLIIKESIEKRIEDIKNPSPSFPVFATKEFDWGKFFSVVKIIIGSLIILIPLINIVVIYNRIVKSITKVNNSFANIDVYLKKRWDLIPNILESVKGYSAYESKILTNITKLRKNNNYSEMNINDKISLNNELGKSVTKILFLQENYPELKANSNYLDLSKQLSSIENEIASSRIKYNDAVMNYNNIINIFPNNLLVRFLKNKEMNMFAISSEEKENIKIKL